ncbi:MAG TPA: biotin--[acetyl-CoA-carboxylase] ligase [Spirochaetota bacterium]|nr:biotin--[acetyl-CoA-carboxylase] ligase [Spirochaetota bacterium]HPJ40837.1 biotin--[acetyl-CoA-carboxylase] ligase [Spirochaetota bacterium]HPR37145.1 biotin--[acetyl-CoA-carboxylase] ligase [Spirochaetota bacterium]HRX46495.1 biotin--[acetyl-CoA-carboxylase] ligase [Spirochaetota bacterium]
MDNYNNRDKILSILYNSFGSWVSGEEISRELGITRTAVWKNVNILRDTGYIIESSNKSGHRLTSSNNILNEFAIRKNLKTSVFGKRDIRIFEATDSTNIEAFNLAAAGAPEGSIVIADRQKAGKGRMGRAWSSPAGKNVYISVILRPGIPPYLAPRLTIVTAVALSDTLIESGVPGHRIKWPNDILVGDKKISGILTEMKGDTDSIEFIITGIGININASLADYPPELQSTVTSLNIILNRTTDRNDFTALLLSNLEKYYNRFLMGEFSGILSTWKERADIINREIKVQQFNETFTGRVIDLNEDGNLLVDTGMEIKTVNSGDINYL